MRGAQSCRCREGRPDAEKRARVFEYLVERPAHRQDRGPDASIMDPPTSTSRILPPGRSAASSDVTAKPRAASAAAAAKPPIPAPIIRTRRSRLKTAPDFAVDRRAIMCQ